MVSHRDEGKDSTSKERASHDLLQELHYPLWRCVLDLVNVVLALY